MTDVHPRSEAMDALRRFATRDFRGWSGLQPRTTLHDIAAAFEVDDVPQPALLGSELRQAGWVTVAADGFPAGIRVWLDEMDVVLLEGEDPDLPGGLQPLLDELGEPEARLDSYLGTLPLEGSEWVYPTRGLALYVNPENMLLLRVAGYAPASLDEYERRLRLDLEMRRLPPRRER
jgi:hypothetical protein